MPRRKKGRDLNGVLLLDKPLGDSSNGVLQRVRWMYNAKKAGHTGALDPLASGMLPICFGDSTKFAQYSLDADKTYEVTATLGIRTTTSDADGEVVAKDDTPISEDQFSAVLPQFRGDIQQVPSMYSALKHEGKPLYHYARQGIEIERPARPITIFKLELLSFAYPEAKMRVHCSKGTYIRSLVDDIGQVLGCGAYVTRLHRTQVAGYDDLPMFSLEHLQTLTESEDRFVALDALLLPIDQPILHLPKLSLREGDTPKFLQGQTLKSYQGEGDVRVYDGNGNRFLGVAQLDGTQALQPKRLIVQN